MDLVEAGAIPLLASHHHRAENLRLRVWCLLLMLTLLGAESFGSPLRNLFLDLAQLVVKVVGLAEAGIALDHGLTLRVVEEVSVVFAHVDSLHLLLIEPLNALAVLPKTELYFFVFGHEIGTDTVLLATVPVSFVAAVVCPRVNTKPMLFVVLILASVNAAIVPNVDAHALHIIFKPLALVATTVQPRVDSNTADLVFTPVTSVLASIVPLVAS